MCYSAYCRLLLALGALSLLTIELILCLQVAALVKDSGPAVQRTQLMKALVKPLMGHASLQVLFFIQQFPASQPGYLIHIKP